MFPIADSVNTAYVPLYGPRGDLVGPAGNRHRFYSVDTPAMSDDRWADIIGRMDMTFQARMYLMWQYADQALYTLAQDDWQVVFRGDTVPFFGFIPLPSSTVTASPMVLTHVDPVRLTAPGPVPRPPIFNEQFIVG